jgi:hypothetical protein
MMPNERWESTKHFDFGRRSRTWAAATTTATTAAVLAAVLAAFLAAVLELVDDGAVVRGVTCSCLRVS